MHVLRIYESYIPVLLQYVTGSDVMLLSITVTAIAILLSTCTSPFYMQPENTW